ncbi:MAG: CHASE4 domain-containing protein [Steroidobacteraceae bacterium]
MRLNTKVVLLLCTLFLAFGAVDYAVQRQVILPSFESLEADLARTDMERVTRAMDGELDQLLTFCADWGNWLETYRYMGGENPAFIDDNMTDSTIVAAGLDLVAYVADDGHYVWRKGLVPGTESELAYKMLEAPGLPADHPFMDAVRGGGTAKGIVMTEHGPMMLVAAPVLDGAGNGPARGSVVLGRVITPKVAERLAEQAQVRLDVLTPSSEDPPPKAAGDLTVPRIVAGPTTNAVFRNIYDIAGRPSVLLRIDVPRAVSARGRDASGYALASVFVAGAIVLVTLLVALRHMVLRPVSRLTRHAVAIAEGDDLTRRMNVDRSDEIGILAREFDRMVDKLSDARRSLVDQSFEAGAAQVTAGVLHNVGNAMTPLSVSVNSLQERLRGAPLGEIDMVLAELDASSADAHRRADLERFLHLATRELVRAVSAAGDDVAAVARQTEAIHAALAQQLRATRTGPVIETTDLVSLVERSAELVRPDLRRALELRLDPSLAAAGSLPLPRITLQQVLQNVVQNAAESVRASGRDHGLLDISCEFDGSPDGPGTLTLRCADDGAGIHPEDLTRIFENGYSTKPRASNQGIGLHWCANALQSIGGSIRAASDGNGATMIVMVPVARPAVERARAA